ncbi:hypothetical protein KNV00_gp124 [Streptomyces phage Bmoc]|uniref:Uncharacterized protein n=1 Tax=Streptomyces phage Bmoc TaxID=2725629 RepID=A0A6M3SY39_9CAUD|nr:hypothetical protein KNV00_gp124 [Streptomyces phage Bmoc]QJD50895.1 hypothetical protein SEA_BMOC_176 [Streptomyces phage Bmoc]
MQIDIRYSFGNGPYTVGGEIDNIPFEMTYFYGEAYLIVLTEDFVLRTGCMYNPIAGKLDNIMTGQLIFNLARQLDSEL